MSPPRHSFDDGSQFMKTILKGRDAGVERVRRVVVGVGIDVVFSIARFKAHMFSYDLPDPVVALLALLSIKQISSLIIRTL